jgi:hypothetical protein
VISLPYPNPVKGVDNLWFNVQTTQSTQVEWSVFTLSLRKVYQNSHSVDGQATIAWNLKDNSGVPVADGLYYLRVKAGSTVKVMKVLILQ